MTNVHKSKQGWVSKSLNSSKLIAQSFRTTIRTSVTLAICLLILVHLIVTLIFLLTPSYRTGHNQGFDGAYKRYALPGPYFKDELISSCPHFYIAGKKNNEWEAWRNPEVDNFNQYHQNYVRFDKLKRSDMERDIARNFCRKVIKSGSQDFTNYREFKLLHNYFSKEYLKEGADSIRLLYTLSKYKPRERKTKIDTLFLLTYRP